MTNAAMLAMIMITSALVFYLIGVWSERCTGQLKGRHLIFSCG